ncbi:MAG: cation-translocating P-type ATPase, partial [Candidatus Aenigmatarchaeota archaeon]
MKNLISNTNWHELETKEVLKRLITRENGLTDKEATSRLQKFGYNELEKRKEISKLQIFIGQFKSLLVLILIGATIFSAIIGEVIDAIAIIIIVILNAVFGFIQEYRAEKTIEALKKLTTPEAIVIRNGKEKKIDSRLIVPGDIVILEEGTRVPADIRLLEITELKIDEAILTGESIPVKKTTEPLKSKSLVDRKNIAYMGTLVTYGRGKGVVISTGMQTEIGKIAHVVQEEKEEQTPLQKKTAEFSKVLGTIILFICTFVIFFGILSEGPLAGKPLTESLIITMIIFGVALAVAAIPEGLPAVMTITLALGLQKLAKKNALIRKLPAVEALGSTTVICADKTGTLTKNEMTITKIWIPNSTIDVTGKGYETKGNFLIDGKQIGSKIQEQLYFCLQVGALCTNANLSYEMNEYIPIGDPTEISIIVAAKKLGIDKKEIENKFTRVYEIPFSSERKMMTTINRKEKGYIVCVKGAPEVILKLCKEAMVEGKKVKMTNSLKKKILDKNIQFANNALRVLAIAYKKTKYFDEKKAENDLVFLGLIGMIDPPREEAIESVRLCKKAGIRVVMITGDHKNTAVAVAKQLGIEKSEKVITGEELDEMNDEELERIVKEVSVYARVNPIQKMKILKALKKHGEIVAMTGDGVNDAPALKKADIGIAMGIKGTDVAKEASKMILNDDNFSTIVEAVKEGRGIYDNIKKFIQYLLSCNVGEVMIIFFAMLIGFKDPTTMEIILPLTALQLLWINILTDGLPALALGVDPPASNIMERPPRNPKESILTKQMLIEILFFGSLMTIATLLLFEADLEFGSTRAITTAFTAVVLIEMLRVYQVRAKYDV